MTYEVEVLPAARKQLGALPRDWQARLTRKMEALGADPRPPGSRNLVGNKTGLRRLRVGDYRIIYQVDDAVRIVTVTNIGHRQGVYR